VVGITAVHSHSGLHYADDSRYDSLHVAVTRLAVAAGVVVAVLDVESGDVVLAPDVEYRDSVQTESVRLHLFGELNPNPALMITLEFVIVSDSVPLALTITRYSAFANWQWVELVEYESMIW